MNNLKLVKNYESRFAKGLITAFTGGCVMILSVLFIFDYGKQYLALTIIGFIIAMVGLWFSINPKE